MKRLILASAAVILVSGCSAGSSTYGTGTSQESQLVSDLASIVSFKKSKTAKIDYEERAKLVKPGSTRDLPAPIETNTSQSAFPGGPEGRRGTGEKPRIVRRGEFDETMTEEDRKFMNWQGPNTKAYREWTQKRVQKVKARKAMVSDNNGGRRYLTEPPNKYRKAYGSAPVGETGLTEDAKEFRKKSKGNIFSRMLGRG